LKPVGARSNVEVSAREVASVSAWKTALLLVAILLVAGPVFAQCQDSSPNCGDGAFYDPSNNFYSPENNLFPPTIPAYFLPSSESAGGQFSVVEAVNDGAYIPSTMMDYDQTVALGEQQLEKQQAREANPTSLADRARKALAHAAPNASAPVLAEQDDAGQVQVCAPGDNCRPIL
jgi:hypothetical protein